MNACLPDTDTRRDVAANAYAWATCARCGRSLYPRTARPTEHGYVCARKDVCARMEDVMFMLSTGEDLPGCAARLGLRDAAFARWLWRHAPELVRGRGYAPRYRRRDRRRAA